MSRQQTAGVLRKVDAALARTIQGLTVVLLGIIILTVTTAVITRWIIFYPLNFADPLSKYLLMWIAFLGAGLVFRTGEHIAVDMLKNKFKGRSEKVLLVALNVLTSIFLAVVIYYGFQFAWKGRTSHDPFVFGISMMIPYLSVPVGALYALIQVNLTTIIHLLDGESAGERSGNS